MVMSLDRALRIVAAEAAVHGSAGQSLLADIYAAGVVPAGKRLALPAGLQGDFPVRPVEVLHALSHATSPLYTDELYDAYMRWGLLRYLGFFENGGQGNGQLPLLGVSEAGCRVAGTQRRVASEELGVGFAVLLARRWFRRALGPGVPIGFIDIDAYTSGSGRGGSVRADYLLIAPDTARAGHYRARLLECKGTWQRHLVRSQMKTAVGQLGESIVFPLPDGIAVSSVTYGQQVRCFAVETCGQSEATYQPDWTDDDVRWGDGEVIWGAENGRALVAALRETWGRLAAFGGNTEAHATWSGTRDREDVTAGADVRERNEYQTPYGTVIGVTETVALGDLRISVTRAVDASVDRALGSGDPAIVTAAQFGFAERIERVGVDQPGTAPQVYSAAPDGSVFFLER
jgi:hypothetical protein